MKDLTPYCANGGERDVCRSRAKPGHIYCTPCYVANGGYNRYNPPRADAHTKILTRSTKCD